MNQPKTTKKLSLESRTVTEVAPEEVPAEIGQSLSHDDLDAVTGGPFPPDDIQSPAS